MHIFHHSSNFMILYHHVIHLNKFMYIAVFALAVWLHTSCEHLPCLTPEPQGKVGLTLILLGKIKRIARETGNSSDTRFEHDSLGAATKPGSGAPEREMAP